MNHINVVGAVIEYNGKILCMQRGKGKYEYISYKYEFPGGKIEPGEDCVSALMRELKEEMEISVVIKESDFISEVTHQYPDFKITMRCYLCKLSTDKFVRKEHINHQWLAPENLNTLDWAQADLPIIESIKKFYSK